MRSVIALLPLFFTPSLYGDAIDQGDIAALFRVEGVTGTIVVASSDGSEVHVHNGGRAKTRFSPASTFKILNTLIALGSGVVDSKDSRFEWDGVDRGLAAWNRDQSVESAYKVSCVWCYQEIARSVGKSKYVAALANVRYGNQRIGDSVDRFWLDGSLRVSAYEQVEFLGKLNSDALPFSKQHIDELKAIMLEERNAQYALYSKTGWTGPELHTGWYIGFVEAGADTWLFAMNMYMDRAEQAPLRKQLALRTLHVLGII